MYSDPLVKFYLGDCREVMKSLPAESIDMVMTSPPFYGLRHYKADEAIWDAQIDCVHEWVEHYQPPKGGHSLPDNPSIVGAQKIINADNNNPRFGIHSNFCSLCGAWRGQLGSEPTPDLFIKHLCDIFIDVKRVLKKTGTIYVNLDDSHSGSGGDHKPGGKNDAGFQGTSFRGVMPKYLDNIPAKSLIGIPARFQLEMIQRGWICRNVIIWHKESVMPESVKDRFTIDFEYVFMFSKRPKYFFERQFEPALDASYERNQKPQGYPIAWNGEDCPISGGSKVNIQMSHLGRNKRTTWTINQDGNHPVGHYACYPEELCRTPIEASCPEFVCTKCGKARTRIYDCTPMKLKGEIRSGMEGWQERTTLNTMIEPNKVELIGLSECGCNALFEPGIVLDPFAGVATTCVMAKKLGRQSIGIEISETYFNLAKERITNTVARML